MLVTDFLEVANSAPTKVVDAELSHLMRTGDGLRAWGYVWLGTDESAGRSLELKERPVFSPLDSGELEVRMTILETDDRLGRAASPR